MNSEEKNHTRTFVAIQIDAETIFIVSSITCSLVPGVKQSQNCLHTNDLTFVDFFSSSLFVCVKGGIQ